MNLRIARKILKAVGTPDERRYTGYQIAVAQARYEKTRTAKAANRFWGIAVLALRGDLFRPLTNEEIERELNEAEAAPLSDEQVERMLAKALGRRGE